MLYNNKIHITVNALCLLLFSSFANATETAPQAAGSWIAIVPPLLTIAVALIIKRVIPALFLGIWVGAWVINDFGLFGIWKGLLDTFQVFVANALSNPDHTAIVLFSMMVGGMVGIITRNGGMQGIVNHIVEWADSARHACLATATLGVAIFFDDYANTLVVGNTMRPVTDSMRVSRAKLAYIVDSTAAPVACIAIVTTWIGYEIGLIGDSLSKMDGLDTEPYLLFLNTLPYSFYPVRAIAFVFMVSPRRWQTSARLQCFYSRACHGHRRCSWPVCHRTGRVFRNYRPHAQGHYWQRQFLHCVDVGFPCVNDDGCSVVIESKNPQP
jgi:hypothetical protein